MAGQNLSLDTISNSATYFMGKWNKPLKLNQSNYVLSHIISKMFYASHGHVFNARIKASHAAIAGAVDLTREWTCTLIGRLRDAGWLRTEAPRLPDGTQEITTFRPGPMMKRLLVMLLKSKQRSKNRVNDRQQKVPKKEEVEKGKAFLRNLVEELAAKMGKPAKK